MVIYIILFIILIIILFYFIKFSNLTFNLKESFDIEEYNKIMLNNNKKKLYKIRLENIKIESEDCKLKCDERECLKLEHRTKVLEKCVKCNSQKNKCFNPTIIDGTCDDCTPDNINDKVDCFDLENYGCPNPENIDVNLGISPYYIEVPDNNVNSPFNKKCIFCWNLNSDL